MDIQRRFPGVHWIWGGGISFVYEVHPRIVVKVPKSGEFEDEQFRKELEIYRTFSQSQPCPYIVQCFLFSPNGIFLEYMRDESLASRIQDNHTRDQNTRVVTTVEKLEPLPLRKEWMNDLTQAVAFLESLGLAHGDLRPENILLDRNKLKLSDFDCTAKIGTRHEACMCPYGRLLNRNELDQGRPGTSGFLGPRTEQFALGSLFYLINYGFEVYGDRCLAEDPYEHGPKVLDLLQNMEFPALNGDPLIDDIIDKCWHNKYVAVAELAARTKALVDEGKEVTKADGGQRKENSDVAAAIQTTLISRWHTVIGRIIYGIFHGVRVWWRSLLQRIRGPASITKGASSDTCDNMGQPQLDEDFLSKREICKELESRGLLEVLSSGEPKQLGFALEWYRHSLSG